MKRNNFVTIYTIILVVLFFVVAAFYIVDVVLNNTPWIERIFFCISVETLIIGTIIRMYKGMPDVKISMYEKYYKEELGEAFIDDKSKRKKLLIALKHYNQNNYKKSLAILEKLKLNAESRKDKIPVILFEALCYTETCLYHNAEESYKEILRYDPYNARACSNLGSIYVRLGKLDEALHQFNTAIQYNSNYYAAYVNRANWYFNVYDFENALKDVTKALSIKNNGTEALNLMTIICALFGDKEKESAYFHMAIANGVKPAELRAAINHYKTEVEYYFEENNK